jgi:hypothetical protein
MPVVVADVVPPEEPLDQVALVVAATVAALPRG